MADRSKIEWTESTWNPVTGCTPVSAGCANCYAEREHDRRHKAFLAGRKMAPQYAEPFEKVQLHWTDRLDQPLRWRKPRRIFVCSGSDLFHEDVPIEFIAEVFDRMACATLDCGKRHEHVDECWSGDPHTFIILTKRPARMQWALSEGILNATEYWSGDCPLCVAALVGQWPLPNVHVGVSVENQQTADERIPLLLQTPAAVRFVSYEPALGPLKLRHDWCGYRKPTGNLRTHEGKGQIEFAFDPDAARLDGVICGGESGPNARPMHPECPRSVRDQCAAADVPFFFKQHGAWVHETHLTRDVVSAARSYPERRFYELDQEASFFRVGKKAAGRVLDGRTHDDLPGRRHRANALNLSRSVE